MINEEPCCRVGYVAISGEWDKETPVGIESRCASPSKESTTAGTLSVDV
jgi:hypothetical protein